MVELNHNSNSLSDKNENEIASRETAGLSQRQIIFKRFVRHKAAMSSLFVLIFIFFFVFSATGLQFGNRSNPFVVPGWWPYAITDIDPEGAIASSCNGGVTGCPTLDVFPGFIDGDQGDPFEIEGLQAFPTFIARQIGLNFRGSFWKGNQ